MVISVHVCLKVLLKLKPAFLNRWLQTEPSLDVNIYCLAHPSITKSRYKYIHDAIFCTYMKIHLLFMYHEI